MNLDDIERLHKIDQQNMLAEIDSLPDQLQSAWELSQKQSLPEWKDIRQVVIAGMGGSAIGADLLAAYAAQTCSVPIFVQRDYGLPAFAQGSDTLVICSSHSGNTEETLSSFETASTNGCRVLAVCTGGKLEEKASQAGKPVWKFTHAGQPRAAVGFSFGLLLGALTRLGLIPDPSAEVVAAVNAMRVQQKSLRAESPVSDNPAKRMAGQLMGRWVTVMGAGGLTPVARRWKGQLNEVAKTAANFEFLPEADHNTLAGLLNPEDLLMPRTMTLFLRAPSDHPRNRLRSDLTRQAYMLEGLNTDFIDARGEGPLAHIWSALHFGDYMAFYLAVAYGVDPTPVAALDNLKASLHSAK
jgi:glucose/mannose-6-phosphate isomerase